MQNSDVVVVGGGFVGLATTYHLARMGARPLLLTADEVGGGTSAANAGRAQVNEGHLDPLNVSIIRRGVERLESLEEELDADFEWHRMGYLCLIKTQELWASWEHRAQVLSEGGISTELIDVKSLQEAEPHLNTDGLLGAAYSLEGLLNPFLLSWAYAKAAERYGAVIRPRMPVTAMEVRNGRIQSVTAGNEKFFADKVMVSCGAWTPQVTRLAGVDSPVSHTHAEAFITEPVSAILSNTLGLADFYEIIHGKEQAVAIGVGPHKNGTLLVTEAVTKTDEIHRRNSAWGVNGVAKDLLAWFPILKDVLITRAWGAPTAFTPDEEPLIGWTPELENLFIGTCLLQTITSVPLLSEWMAGMVLGEDAPEDLSMWSPSRFSNN